MEGTINAPTTLATLRRIAMRAKESQGESRGKRKVDSEAKFSLRFVKAGSPPGGMEQADHPDFVPLLEIAKVNRVRIRICAEHSERPQDSVSSRPAPERGRDLMFGCNLAPLDFRHGFLQFGTLFRRRFARAFVSFGLERQEHRNCIILAFPGP